jgi:hypothetical protein
VQESSVRAIERKECLGGADKCSHKGANVMIEYAIPGALMIAASIAVLWYFLPRGGKAHPWTEKAYVQAFIPIAIIALFVFGVAIFVWSISEP